MKKRLFSIFLFVLLLSLSFLHAEGTKESVIALETEGAMLSNADYVAPLPLSVFPFSARWEKAFVLPGALREKGLGAGAVIDGGISHRALTRDAEDDGEYNVADPASRFYQVRRSDIEIYISDSLIRERFLDEDVLSLRLAFLVEKEKYYERMGWHRGTEGVFRTSSGALKTGVFEAIPSFEERKSDSYGFSLSAAFNWAEKKRTGEEGVWADVALSVYPWSVGGSYTVFESDIGGAYTLLSLRGGDYEGTRLTALSLHLSSVFDFRYAHGDVLPLSVTASDGFWRAVIPDSPALLSNRTEIVLSGPQLGLPDIYPRFVLSSENALAFGDGTPFFSGSVALSGEMDIHDMFSLYGEIGYVYSSYLSVNSGFQCGMGVKVVI